MSELLKGCHIHSDLSKQEIEQSLNRVFDTPYSSELKINMIGEWLFKSEQTASLKACSKCEVCSYQITLMREWLGKTERKADSQNEVPKNNPLYDKQGTVDKLSEIVRNQAKVISQYATMITLKDGSGNAKIDCCLITETLNQGFTMMKNNYNQVSLETKFHVFAVITFFLTNPNISSVLCKRCVNYLDDLEGIGKELKRQLSSQPKTNTPPNNFNPQYQSQPQPNTSQPNQPIPKWTGADFKKATPEERMEWIKAVVARHSDKQLTVKLVINKYKEKYDFFDFSATHEGGVNVAPRLISYGSRQFCFSGVVDYSVKEIINWVSIHYEKNVFINIMLHYPKECHTKEHQEHIEKALTKLREQISSNIDFKINIPYDKIT